MKTFFEYFYFRLAQKSFKSDGANAFTALLNITIVQFWWIFNVGLFFFYLLNNSEPRKLYLYEKLIGLTVLVALYCLNYKLHNGQYLEYRERWKSETKKQKVIRWYFLLFVTIASWFLVFLNGWIFSRLRF